MDVWYTVTAAVGRENIATFSRPVSELVSAGGLSSRL